MGATAAKWRRKAHWLWALLGLAVCAALGASFVRTLRPAPDQVLDFFQEWASARNYREGLPVYADQSVSGGRYISPEAGERMALHFNAHPPPSVLLALPLAGLAYPDAFLVWNLLSLAAFAASLAIVAWQLRIPVAPWMVPPALALLLVCAPFREQVLHGQLNLVLLLLLVGAWAAERSGRPALAGALVGAAAAVKVFPGFFILYFALRRQWRAAAAAVASLAALTLLALALFGTEAYRDYFDKGMPAAAACRGDWLNCSLAGFWSRLLGPSNDAKIADSPAAALALTALSALLLLAVLVPRVVRAASREQTDLAFGSWCVAMLLVSPIAWNHYLLLLLIPVALLWRDLPGEGWSRWAFRGVLVLLWLNPIWLDTLFTADRWPNGRSPLPQLLLVVALPNYALLGLFLLTLYALRGAGAQPAPAESGVVARVAG
jgi:alpha-1,2-mannosyltransferase